MAKNNYLISGLPGTGKTSVCQTLQSMGYSAIDADQAFGYQSPDGWLWKNEKIMAVINDLSQERVFICGSATNREDYLPSFDKVFILHVDDKTLKHRLQNRTNNGFGKNPKVTARQVQLNQGIKEYSIRLGRIVIDATQPLDLIVRDIIAQIT